MALSIFMAAALCGQLPQAKVESYTWQWHNKEWTQLDLMKGKVQVGAYDPAKGTFRYLHDWTKNKWSDPCQAPVNLPSWIGPPPSKNDKNNFGLDWQKLEVREAIYRDGREVTNEDFKAALEKVPDDKSLPWLTVIGSKEARERVLKDWNASNETAADKVPVRVWSVPPDHWSLKDHTSGRPAYHVGGDPTVYLQAADGKVLHRQDDWQGPADVAAIREAKKAYDAKKDLDWRKWLSGWAWSKIDPAWIVGAAGLGLVLLLGKKG